MIDLNNQTFHLHVKHHAYSLGYGPSKERFWYLIERVDIMKLNDIHQDMKYAAGREHFT